MTRRGANYRARTVGRNELRPYRNGRAVRIVLLLVLSVLLVAACVSPAQRGPTERAAQAPAATPDVRAVEDFYRGKTVRIIVGFTAGGGFDVVGRLVARHLPKHIPGNPTVVVENMTGAGGLVASNHLYHNAPKDGTVLGVFPEPNLQAQLLRAEGVQFDARDFNWLGSTQVQTNTCVARTDSGITSMRALQEGGRQIIIGTTGPGTNLHDFPAALKGALNANIRLVPGYPGAADMALALESGEITGFCRPWESLKATHSHWFSGSSPFATILVQQGLERHPELPNVPLAEELARTQEERQVIRLSSSTNAISKPLVAPPGVPADRVAVLRQAFVATMQDPELLREAENANIDLSVKRADQVETILNGVLNSPSDIAQRLKAVLESG